MHIRWDHEGTASKPGLRVEPRTQAALSPQYSQLTRNSSGVEGCRDVSHGFRGDSRVLSARHVWVEVGAPSEIVDDRHLVRLVVLPGFLS